MSVIGVLLAAGRWRRLAGKKPRPRSRAVVPNKFSNVKAVTTMPKMRWR